MFALNQGEVCTCPSRGLIQKGSTTAFEGARPGQGHHQGNPLDTGR